MAYIQLKRKAFGRNLTNQSASSAGRLQAGVRRPLRGIQSKADTWAMIKVITDAGQELALFDSSGTPSFLARKPTTRPYSNFFIARLRETRTEKTQIVETFGESWVFFFGERPRTISFNGVLMNTVDFNWKAEWWKNYDTYFRGTSLVDANARLYLFYDNTIVEGYLMNAQTEDMGEEPNMVTFSTTMLVTGYTQLSQVGSDMFPLTTRPAADPRMRTSLGQRLGGGTGPRSVRSKISDNYDEYIGSSEYWDRQVVDDVAATAILSAGDAEQRVVKLLTTMGFDSKTIGKSVRAGTGFVRANAFVD